MAKLAILQRKNKDYLGQKLAIKHAEEAITHAEAASGKAGTKKNY
jgi:hypothetical protein